MDIQNSVYHRSQRILQSSTLAQHAGNLTDLYTIIEQLCNDVLDSYPHIACRTMCNTCCKGTSMPAVSAVEWAYLYHYILNYWSEEQKQERIQSIHQLYTQYGSILWEVHDNIQSKPDMEKIERFARILPQLAETTCPLLINETCSVYPSRPGKCRAHGAFLFVFDNFTQLHACQSEVEKMEDYLNQQGSRKILMPVWNEFEKKIANDLNEPNTPTTILAIWLYAHIQDGKFIPEPNLRPDFDAIRGNLG